MKPLARSSRRPLRPAWRKTSSGEHLTKILDPLIADHGLRLEHLLHLLVLHKYLPLPGQDTGQVRKPRVVTDYKSNPVFRPPLPADLPESVLSIQKFDLINLSLHTPSSVSPVEESLHQLYEPLLQELPAPTDSQESICKTIWNIITYMSRMSTGREKICSLLVILLVNQQNVFQADVVRHK